MISSRLSVFVIVPVALLVQVGTAADIYARRMQIVKTADGQETWFEDSVSITDGATRITAGAARFNEAQGVAVLSDSVFIGNPDVLVWSDSAVYRFDEKTTRLYGDVRVEQDSMVITAPRIDYSIVEKRVDADSGIVVANAAHGFRLYGVRGTYDLDRNIGSMDSLPVLVLGRKDDSLRVTARTIAWSGRKEQAIISGAVRVGDEKSRLECDTLLYFAGPDSGVAWGEPRIADSLNHTEGDTSRLQVSDGALRKVVVTGDARGSYETGTGSEVRVAGGVIRIQLEQGEVSVIEVEDMTAGRLVRGSGSAVEPGD